MFVRGESIPSVAHADARKHLNEYSKTNSAIRYSSLPSSGKTPLLIESSSNNVSPESSGLSLLPLDTYINRLQHQWLSERDERVRLSNHTIELPNQEGVSKLLLQHLLRPGEDPSQYYPSPPESFVKRLWERKLDKDRRTDELDSVEKKRSRRDVRLNLPESMNPGVDKPEEEAWCVPKMHFTEGFRPVDHMGRVFTTPTPASLHWFHQQRDSNTPCTPPRAPKRVFQAPHRAEKTAPRSVATGGASTSSAGVQLVRWGPPAYGHLLFSADLSGVAKLWRCPSALSTPHSHDKERDSLLIASYHAHRMPVKSLQITKDASIMTTGSTDGTIAMWDVETGKCLHHLSATDPSQPLPSAVGGSTGMLPVVDHLHHPADESHIILAAVDRKVVLYDVRVASQRMPSNSDSCCAYYKPQRVYEGHRGTILHLSLLGSSGSKLLTTSEDKTLRTWDFAIPVQIKQFADAGMHAISHVIPHPVEKDLLAAQSLNNKVMVFQDEGGGRLRLLHHREFSGHKIAGTRCELSFSRDGMFLSSGDINGELFIWRWSTGESVKHFTAHRGMLTTHAWHPIEPSKIVTGGWDGAIKEWA